MVNADRYSAEIVRELRIANLSSPANLGLPKIQRYSTYCLVYVQVPYKSVRAAAVVWVNRDIRTRGK
jgi:hypothetical protein